MGLFTHSGSLMGIVRDVDQAAATFTIVCRSGDQFSVQVCPTTSFGVLKNLDGLNRDRVPDPPNFNLSNPDNVPSEMVRKYILTDALISVQGNHIEREADRRFEARSVTL